jgi:hypothetical protein
MSGRNDNRYIEDAAIAFAMYCDENGLGVEEGRMLAERIYDELASRADDRELQEGVPA